ncbi:MAG: hypothetical protein R3B49_11460 [Phycisphaerales bacterium]
MGDIAGWTDHGPTLAPFRALAASPLLGTSYVEFFAIGPREPKALDVMRAFVAEHESLFERALGAPVRLGLTPHAPYTVTRAAYDACCDFAGHYPLTTHLAESLAERTFIAEGTGPKRDLLEVLNFWNESVAADIGVGSHPIAHLAAVLARTPWLVAHVNDADDEGIATLAHEHVGRLLPAFGRLLRHPRRVRPAPVPRHARRRRQRLPRHRLHRQPRHARPHLDARRDASAGRSRRARPALALEMGTTRGVAPSLDPALFTFTPAPSPASSASTRAIPSPPPSRPTTPCARADRSSPSLRRGEGGVRATAVWASAPRDHAASRKRTEDPARFEAHLSTEHAVTAISVPRWR